MALKSKARETLLSVFYTILFERPYIYEGEAVGR